MMKGYKKSGLLLGIIILSSSPTAMNAITKEELNEDIQEGIDKFFYGLNPHLNLFQRTTDVQIFSVEVISWGQALQNLQNYVLDNAGGNPKLLRANNLAIEVGSGLIEVIKTGYQTIVARDAEKFVKYQELEIDIEYLLSAKKDLDDTINNLLSDPLWIGKKREVRNLLAKEILPMFETIIKRVVEDFIKVTKIIGWVPTPALVGQIEAVYPAMGEQYF